MHLYVNANDTDSESSKGLHLSQIIFIKTGIDSDSENRSIENSKNT